MICKYSEYIQKSKELSWTLSGMRTGKRAATRKNAAFFPCRRRASLQEILTPLPETQNDVDVIAVAISLQFASGSLHKGSTYCLQVNLQLFRRFL